MLKGRWRLSLTAPNSLADVKPHFKRSILCGTSQNGFVVGKKLADALKSYDVSWGKIICRETISSSVGHYETFLILL